MTAATDTSRSLLARPFLRPVPFALALGLLSALPRGAGVDRRAPSPAAALTAALAGRGLLAAPDDVVWVQGPSGALASARFGGRAIVRAHTKDEPNDIYAVAARLSPEGEVLELGSTWNLTRTTGVDEGRLSASGSLVATVTTVDGLSTGVHVIDLAGRAPASYPDFTRAQRLQIGIANWQQTGQSSGVLLDAYSLDPVAKTVDVAWKDGRLAIDADGRRVEIDAARRVVTAGEGWVRPILESKARPGNVITWAVDRARALPWVGEERMQWVKAVAFTALDYVHRFSSSVTADTTATDVASDLQGLGDDGKATPSFAAPETGFPPAPMESMLKPALPGEGKWISLEHDPFITRAPGTPPAFVTSYLRTDKERSSTRVYVTLWDPRQIALHMVAGKVEPVSATGEAGPGVVPRTPEVMKNLVAGFNGGFQAKHGEFGMQADEILYLPPKPYAATILELADGTTAFGTWPNSEAVPDEVLSYRQNMTAMVEGGKFNPWRRTWWGGTPDGWADTIHTTRSALCLTKENFLGYFWGNDLSPDALAAALLGARCQYGVHLDMNPGLAGFEFYDVEDASTFVPLGRPLQKEWEEEGSLKEMPELRYRVRRMVRGMSHQNFPQYVHRHERDFFYLTRRNVLPGAPLPGPREKADERAFRTTGLPQHGFPYAVATASRTAQEGREGRLRFVRVDPRAVRPAGSPGTSETTPTVLTFAGGIAPRPGETALWYSRGAFVLGADAPEPDAAPLVTSGPATAPVRAALGVHDEDGHLDWVEPAADLPADAVAKVLEAALKEAGSSHPLLLRGEPRMMLGGALDAAGQPAAPLGGTTARLVRGAMVGARPYFEDTALVPPSVWQPLQQKRVRYFKKPAAAPKEAPTASPEGAPNGAPAPHGSASPASSIGHAGPAAPRPAGSAHGSPARGGEGASKGSSRSATR